MSPAVVVNRERDWLILFFGAGMTVILAVEWPYGAPRVSLPVLLVGIALIATYVFLRWGRR